MAIFLPSFIFLFFISQSTNVFASGAVNRQRQMKDMREQAMQQAYAQQAAQQQQQEIIQQQQIQAYQQQQVQAYQQQQVQAYQQQQVQAYQQQQVQAAQQQIIMQAVQQKIAEQMKEQQVLAAAQQMLIQVKQQRQVVVEAQQIQYKNAQEQAMVVSIAERYQEAVMQEAVKQKVILEAAQMAQIQQMAQAKAQAIAMQAFQDKKEAETLQVAGEMVRKNRPFEPGQSDNVEDVVDITDVWRKLDIDSRGWTLLIDNQAKVATVSEYLDRFRKQGIRIQQLPIDYVQMIDDMAIQSPTLLTRPFKEVLQIMAVMQYDLDNGVDKDVLAQKMLGQQLYLSNKKRLGR